MSSLRTVTLLCFTDNVSEMLPKSRLTTQGRSRTFKLGKWRDGFCVRKLKEDDIVDFDCQLVMCRQGGNVSPGLSYAEDSGSWTTEETA